MWGDRLEIFGLDLRHTPSVEAFCQHLQRDARPPRLHRQQRLPDRAPAARVLPPHARGRDGVSARHARPRPAAARRLRGAAALRHAARGRARARRRRPGDPIVGVARSAELSQVPLLPEDLDAEEQPVPRGAPRPGPAAGRPARPQLLAAAARRGVVGRAARDPARERRRAVRPERAPEAADAAHARARQAHRQRVGRRGAVLPALQDDAAPAHEHGEGRAQHDDAHVGGRLPVGRHPHEQRRHRAG